MDGSSNSIIGVAGGGLGYPTKYPESEGLEAVINARPPENILSQKVCLPLGNVETISSQKSLA